MISFPNCKINLGLHIVAKRPDGYHDLETVFYPIPLKDALEVVRAQAPRSVKDGRVVALLRGSGSIRFGAPRHSLFSMSDVTKRA